MIATTQFEYYTHLLKLVGCITGFTLGTALFFGTAYLIFFYARYWR